MKKLLIASLLLVTTLAGSPLRVERGPAAMLRRNATTIIWIPLGTGSLCAALPDSLPSCAYTPGIVGWMKITMRNGVMISQEVIAL